MKKNYDDESFNFNDLDELIEKMFGNISSLPNLGDINPNTHHHSISYRFGTEMDEPEIHINGEKVDNETLKNLFRDIGIDSGIFPRRMNFNPTETQPELDMKELSISESPEHFVVEYKDTCFEVDKDRDSALLTIELPGVEKNHIVISQVGQKVSVIGEKEDTAYKVDFDIEFTLDNTKTKIVDANNNIYQIHFEQ